MVKNGYYEDDGFIFSWDLGVIFLGIPNRMIDGVFYYFFFNFGLKVVMEKCLGCFLVCKIFWENVLKPRFNVFWWLKNNYM